MALTRRTFLRNLGALASCLAVGITVTRPQREFRQDYYKTLTIKGPDNSTLVGYKGAQFYEAGVVYAPYIPIYRTPNDLYWRPMRLTKGRNLIQLG